MSKILIIPPKSVPAKDKLKLSKAGFIVLEIDDPQKVVIVNENLLVQGNDLALSALKAISETDSSYANTRFVRELYKRLLDKELSQKESANDKPEIQQP